MIFSSETIPHSKLYQFFLEIMIKQRMIRSITGSYVRKDLLCFYKHILVNAFFINENAFNTAYRLHLPLDVIFVPVYPFSYQSPISR